MSLESLTPRLDLPSRSATIGSRSSEKARVLVVEDGPSEREALVRVLQFEGYEVPSARDPATAMRFIDHPIDVVISDLRMGKQSGIDLLQMWRERRPTTPFIIVTAYGEVESAVNAMKLGARDYITKPIDPTRLLNLVQTCIAERAIPTHGRTEHVTVDRLWGDSPAMRQVRDQVVRAAATESPVLIVGEPGTGKELAARAIHHHGARKSGPFVSFNTAALPEAEIESELFGEAAATGESGRPGRFESAQGGILFIDEVGDFGHSAQASLLRAMETRVGRRPGVEAEPAVDARLIAASARDLRQMVQKQAFRSDLYFRLNVVSISLPRLRDRREDIPLLIEHFMREVAASLGKRVPLMSDELYAGLLNYDWPGNVRELRNCLESMIVLSDDDELQVADLPAGIAVAIAPSEHAGAADDETRLDSLEKSVILQTLRKFDGNRTRAAHELGISVRTLQRRLKAWGINAPE